MDTATLLFWDQIVSLRPKDWDSLASRAKSREEFYSLNIRHNSAWLSGIILSDQTPPSADEIFTCASTIELNTTLHNSARCVHWGAKAAKMENRKGKFTTTEKIIESAQTVMLAGSLIGDFLTYGRSLVGIGLLNETEAGDQKNELLADMREAGRGNLMNMREAQIDVFCPKIETVLKIVRSEEIDLPAPAERAIIEAMRLDLN